MRLVINLILAAVVIGLIWVLIGSIREPIAFRNEYQRRENAVIDRLRMIRQAQEAFRDIKGGFAPSFDSLSKVLRQDSFRVINVLGDPDDPNFTGVVTYDTLYFPAYDSIQALGIKLDSLPYVPFSSGGTFEIAADTLTYQSTLVNVVEVGTKYSEFMGPYSDPRFARYDQSYDPAATIKFGDLNRPNLSGNWE